MKRASIAICLLVSGCGAVTETDGNARIRVAHLSPDAPAVDFCLAEHGTGTWVGPTLAKAGHASGLAYGNVTKYFDVEAMQYDVRIVAPGAADCATALGGLPDFTALPTLPGRASATIAAEGVVAFGSQTPFTLKPYFDDDSVDAGNAKLRFVHASPGTPAVDVGVGGGALFTTVFADISYAGIAPNTNGYVTTEPLAGVEISARVHGTLSDALSIKPASLPADTIATAFAIGQVGSSATPLRVLLCIDNGAPNALLSACTIVGGTPERAHLRIAHLSPDTPPVDLCIAPANGAFSKATLKSLGVFDGLAYPNVTNYVEFPVGMYDVRIIHATASDCSTGAVPDLKGFGIHNGVVGTVAAIGVLDRAGAAANDPGLRLALFADATDVSSGKAKLRFIHASPGTPNVDVGLGSGASFVKVFSNVAFGSIAVHTPIDALGFVETNPFTNAVSARLAGATTDALTVPSVNLPASAIVTAFAIGGKTGATTNPLKVLLCTDNAAASGLVATCVQAP